VSSEDVSRLFFLVAILAGAYLLIIRPTRRRAREVDSLQRSLAVGSEVMLTSGIFGRVLEIDDERAEIEIAPDVVIAVHRGAIGKVVPEVASIEDSEVGEDSAEHLGVESSESEPPVAESADGNAETHTDSDPESRGAH
jgi:preprotein translocase subunit YajC